MNWWSEGWREEVSPDTSWRLGLRSGGGGGAARLRWDAEATVKAGGKEDSEGGSGRERALVPPWPWAEEQAAGAAAEAAPPTALQGGAEEK